MDDDKAKLHEELSVTMEQVMASLGGGTLMIPEEMQRGIEETANPRLDADGLRELLDDLQRLLP